MELQEAQETRAFSTLRRIYWFALGAIALSIILSQILIQSFLIDHSGDAREINVAGRQRMLSQKLAKSALLINQSKSQDEIKLHLKDLDETSRLWKASHELLKTTTTQGDFKDIISLFDQIENHYQSILGATQSIVSQPTLSDYNTEVSIILENEGPFLETMDQIVNEYDKMAEKKVNYLRRLELILLGVALVILLLEIIFLFRPAAIKIDTTLEEVKESKSALLDSNQKLLASNSEKKLAYDKLNTLNNAIEQAVLFSFVDENDKIVYISSQLRKILKISEPIENQKLITLISSDPIDQEQIKRFISNSNYKANTREFKISNQDKKDVWLEITVVPILSGILQYSKMLLFKDISTRKEVQNQLDQIKEEQFNHQINEQQINSLLVIEAQEDERKRIARDLHDGIGQTLTALKFTIESLDLNEQQESQQKLVLIKDEVKKLIREVRFASFNLTPPELTDYGIETALARLVEQLDRISNTHIKFVNLGNQEVRFDKIIETNLYRIVQEAANNALKYAEAQNLQINYQHSPDMLSISIIDDGRGFDLDKVRSQQRENRGMGLTFMEERVNYLKGRIFFQSKKDEGTVITINIPSENLYLVTELDRMNFA